jgi:hypothetical protein
MSASRVRILGPAVLVAVVACAGTETNEVVPVTPPPAVAQAPEEPTVAVFLTEYTIDMPSRLEAGEVRITVTNQGVEDHNLRILHAGSDEILWQTEGNVGSSLTQEALIELPEGEYVVLCDFAGHDSRGMFMTLEVRER